MAFNNKKRELEESDQRSPKKKDRTSLYAFVESLDSSQLNVIVRRINLPHFPIDKASKLSCIKDLCEEYNYNLESLFNFLTSKDLEELTNYLVGLNADEPSSKGFYKTKLEEYIQKKLLKGFRQDLSSSTSSNNAGEIDVTKTKSIRKKTRKDDKHPDLSAFLRDDHIIELQLVKLYNFQYLDPKEVFNEAWNHQFIPTSFNYLKRNVFSRILKGNEKVTDVEIKIFYNEIIRGALAFRATKHLRSKHQMREFMHFVASVVSSTIHHKMLGIKVDGEDLLNELLYVLASLDWEYTMSLGAQQCDLISEYGEASEDEDEE